MLYMAVTGFLESDNKRNQNMVFISFNRLTSYKRDMICNLERLCRLGGKKNEDRFALPY